MKANELRIGNWVKYNGFNRKIVSLNLDTEVNAEPIELTEEILFKNTKTSRFISRYKSELIFDNYDSNICIFKQKLIQICLYCDFRKKIYYIKINGKKIYIKYLHQLQTLYWCLTNEELEIKL